MSGYIKGSEVDWKKSKLKDLEECVRDSKSNLVIFEGKTIERKVAKFILFRFAGVYVE